MSEEKSLLEKIVQYVPVVEKPTFKLPFNTRLKWMIIVLSIYFLLSYIPVAGILPSHYEQFKFFELVLGSKFGSLMTLGIGPIVTAGIILELLVGSKIIDWDLTKEEGRRKFENWNKLLAIIFCFVEGFAYVISGAIPVIPSLPIIILVVLQLALGGIIVILLDQIISKWGFGSGVSLFIAAGIGSTILIRLFSFLPPTCTAWNFASCIPSISNPPSGLFWQFLISLFTQNLNLFFISIIPILATIFVFLFVVYTQDIRIEIPLSYGMLRGFGRSWPLKLFYTSNIPVILAAALLANIQLMARAGLQPMPDGTMCGPLACFDQSGRMISGILYFIYPPHNFLINLIQGNLLPLDWIRVITYTIFFVAMSTIFSVFWMRTSGMDPESVAKQIHETGLQIPGYRRDERIIRDVLNRYIPPLAVLGGFLVGLLAVMADFLGAVGTGTGLLLTVMIIYNYYEIFSSENLEDAPSFIRKLLGEE